MSFYLSATATPEYFDDPELTERELLHEDDLDRADQSYRHTPMPLAYVERPSDRERRAHRSDRLVNDARAVVAAGRLTQRSNAS